jgi:hypothetical protein
MPLKPREDIPEREEIPEENPDEPPLGRLITPLPLNDVPELLLTEGTNAPSLRDVLKERTFRNWPLRLAPLGIPSNLAPLPLNPSPLVMILALPRSKLMLSRPTGTLRLIPMAFRPLPLLPRLISMVLRLLGMLLGALNPGSMPEKSLLLLMLPAATPLPLAGPPGPRLRFRTLCARCARGSPMIVRSPVEPRPVMTPLVSRRSLTPLPSLKSLTPLLSLKSLTPLASLKSLTPLISLRSLA